MAHSLGHLFDIAVPKATTPITQPRLTRQKTTAPSAQELDDLIFGEPLAATPPTRTPKPTSPSSPTTTPSTLEAATPPPTATTVPDSFWHPYKNRYRVLCACLVYFGNGLNDAAPGALLPHLETYYAIGYATVSLIFVTTAVGFISAAFCTDAVLSRLGRARTLVASEAVMMAGYAIVVSTPPHFAGVVVAFFLLGFGAAINLALNNVFCANLRGSTVVLGLAHGAYGVGGTVAPVAATAMVARGWVWSRFYVVALGVRAACVVFNVWAWKGHEREEEKEGAAAEEERRRQEEVVAAGLLMSELERTASGSRGAVEGAGVEASQQEQPSKWKLLKQALGNRVTLIGALFIFMYQGAEVSIAGWVISFLINYRGGSPDQVGYVTAGFFGGITLGRFALTPFCHRLGETPCIYALTVGAAVLDLLVWHVPNLISNTIFVSLVGLLLGPVYPCAQTIFSRLLPRSLQTSAVGFIASAGSSGGAVAPFLTGLLAQAAGTWVLHPVCLAAFVGMVVCWLCLPKVGKRME